MTIASSHVRIAVSFLCMLVTVKGSQSHYRPKGCHRSRTGAHVRMNVVSYWRRELKDWGCGARPSAFERKCNSQGGGTRCRICILLHGRCAPRAGAPGVA